MMRSIRVFFVALLVSSVLSRSIQAQADRAQQADDPVDVRLEMSREDGSVNATLTLMVQSGWKLYAREAGDAGLPLVVRWQLPAGWEAGAERWPRPRRQSVAGLETWVYEGRVRVERELVRSSVQSATVVVHVDWAACADVCVRGTSQARATLRDASGNSGPSPRF